MDERKGNRTTHIQARTLKAAKNIAKRNKNLLVNSGNLLNSAEVEDGGLKTYSFRYKDV